MTNKHQYSEEERAAIYRVIDERRDMRHFLNDPVDEDIVQRLIKVAHQAPSVGFIQPWRIIRIKIKIYERQSLNMLMLNASKHLSF